MPTYTQDHRPLMITTPLGKDILLLVGISGTETVSRMFEFRLDVLAENKTEVPFERLLGQKVSAAITLADGKTQRFFSGLVRRVAQGERDLVFTTYQLEIAPPVWLLTRRTQSRIFQHVSVPEVLKKVLDGIDVTFELQGQFEPRDFLVQYRETDFQFFSRLCEEEGFFYFFKHTSGGGCQMVVANTPQSHLDMPAASALIYEGVVGGNRAEDRVLHWRKVQELRSGKVTLWDHCFELPHKHLETNKVVVDSVKIGEVTHKLAVGGNQNLELYDWPGGYAKRFDGVDKGGGDDASGLSGISPAGARLVTTLMQEETAAGLVVEGASKCRQLTTGYKFSLQRHFNAKGWYVVLAVEHDARLSGYRSGESGGLNYDNRFRCLPLEAPFRPARETPRPVVHGTQTAVVVGSAGDEIFTDKYGRIKVQFHWDRQGKGDADSSCWVRVATPWAGPQWGMIHIPRVGQEVVVAFEEGDPDRPIVVGSVYNAQMMPPYKLPDDKTQSGVKSRSSLKGSDENFNEICFEDKKGEELLYIRAEKDQKIAVENDEAHWVGHDRVKEVDNDETTTIKNNRTETVEQGDEKLTVKQGNRTVEISMGNETLNIKMGNQSTKLDLGASTTEAMQSITLKVGMNSITIDQTGVTIQALMVTITGQVQTQVSGLMTTVTGTAMLTESGGIIMIG